MHVHDLQAVKRDIKFTEYVDTKTDVRASAHCCWNCFWSVMTYDSLWCDRDLEEIDMRDLCISWEGERYYL
jgi:hypothetical protein